jgi:hypothetical protein
MGNNQQWGVNLSGTRSACLNAVSVDAQRSMSEPKRRLLPRWCERDITCGLAFQHWPRDSQTRNGSPVSSNPRTQAVKT